MRPSPEQRHSKRGGSAAKGRQISSQAKEWSGIKSLTREGKPPQVNIDVNNYHIEIKGLWRERRDLNPRPPA
jgi:hypothetical protein